MLPYEMMNALANQRLEDLRSEASNYRQLKEAGLVSQPFQRFASVVRRAFKQAQDAVTSPDLNGPIQPAI